MLRKDFVNGYPPQKLLWNRGVFENTDAGRLVGLSLTSQRLTSEQLIHQIYAKKFSHGDIVL